METSSLLQIATKASRSKIKNYHRLLSKTRRSGKHLSNADNHCNSYHQNFNAQKSLFLKRSNARNHNLLRHGRNHNRGAETDRCPETKFHVVKCRDNEKSSLEGESSVDLIVGRFTREVYNAICLRLGDTLHIPEASVKALFNDMHLFPSDSQVTKMLQCARQYSRRNGTNPNYLTFGEFCVFAREMQNHSTPKSYRKMSQQKVNKCPSNRCEVFLGGSCNPTTWRADTAIPELQKQGISFYNPQVSMWAPELLDQEHDAKQSASVLLFVIDSQTRSTVGMLEVAYLVACGRCVVVVAQPYKIGQTIMGEVISEGEYEELVQGQKSLLDLIKSKGVQIHTNLSSALQCTADILRNVSNGSSSEEQVIHKLKRLREVYDCYKGEMRIYDVIEAYRRLTNRSLEISKLYHYFNLQHGTNGFTGLGTNGSEVTLSFEKFCAVMAELSSESCGTCNIEAWASQTFTRNQQQPEQQCQSQQNCAGGQFSVTQSPPQQRTLYDVYLGGSLSTGTKWRESTAIPLLEKRGLKYYNPAIRDSKPNGQQASDVSQWQEEIERCKIALFVITNDTRSLTSMILAAHCMGSGKEVVLCVEQLNAENCIVAGETLTKTAIKDYNRARAYITDSAERREVPVFDSVELAINCVIGKLAASHTTDTTNRITSEIIR
ncbi:uncharacterized protein raw isoform X2 [Euwallacea fornicatus]|uniref:uncharacterized protein raw isoform X2 n=1 Tax=Euwallacea fornicatus TaxID=995702 RepID=UPI00338F8EA3